MWATHRSSAVASIVAGGFKEPFRFPCSLVSGFGLTTRGHGSTLRTVQPRVRDAGMAAGGPTMHPHLLRHTAATRHLVPDGDALTLQHQLGHSGLDMTSRYVHPTSA